MRTSLRRGRAWKGGNDRGGINGKLKRSLAQLARCAVLPDPRLNGSPRSPRKLLEFLRWTR
eukprot:7067291-Pyramimonas_sp.AAC.1